MEGGKILASKEAEQSILGSVFYDESTIRILIDKVRVKDFYYLRHQLIYQAMLDLFNEKNPIDPTTVITKLDDKGELNDCGGSEYIIGLMDSIPSIANLETYVELIKDKAVQRNVVQVCSDILKETNDNIPNSKEFLDSVEKRIFTATSERTTSDLVPVRTMLDSVYSKIQSNAQSESTVIGLDVGYKRINELTLGLQNSELIILAARPSMGKTALALNIACNVASTRKRPYVAFFSLEMGLDQLALRLISQKSNIPQDLLKIGKFNDNSAWSRINYAINELQGYNLYFDDSGVSTVQDLRSVCRKKKNEGKLDFVVIDYLQLLSTADRYESRTQEVSSISRALKEMARELNIPVLALSQLSRTLEQRSDKRPIMSDLRESGSIEQDADIVMFIYRDFYYNKQTENPNLAEVNIVKNRNGMIGRAELIFKDSCTNFLDMDEGRKE